MGSGVMDEDNDDKLEALLGDLAQVYKSSEAVEEYRALTADPETARESLSWFDETEELTPAELRKEVFLELCNRRGLVASVDWAEDYETVLDDLDDQFKALSAGLPQDRRDEILRDLDSKCPMERGDAVGWLFGPLAAYADEFGLAIIALNTFADMYHFVVVPIALREKWVGKRASPGNLGIVVEDPSWQFEKQLTGSPYQRFFRVDGSQ